MRLSPPLLFLLLTASCQRAASIDEHRVTAAVRVYNLALPQVYASGSIALMAGSIGGDERKRLGNFIEALTARGERLEARQESFQVERVTVEKPPLFAALTAREVWWYRRVDPKTGAERLAGKRIHYHLRYHCVQTDGRWKVDRLEMLGSEDHPGGK